MPLAKYNLTKLSIADWEAVSGHRTHALIKASTPIGNAPEARQALDGVGLFGVLSDVPESEALTDLLEFAAVVGADVFEVTK